MINSMILVQQNLVTILLGNVEKIVSSSNNVDTKYSDDVVKILEDLKNSLELCNKNIVLLQDLSYFVYKIYMFLLNVGQLFFHY